MPRLLLVVPPCFLDRTRDFEVGFPVHLPMLGRLACEAGWTVEYLDMMLEEKEGWDSFAKLEEYLRAPDLRLVGISNHTVRTSVTTSEVARRVKANRPSVAVVVGGVNSTFMYRELLAGCAEIDFVLRGYAQAGLRALLSRLDEGRSGEVPGLVERSGTGLEVAPLSRPIAEDFRWGAVEGVDVERYLAWTRTYSVLTHTGCGFSCNFCTAVMPGPYQDKEVHRAESDVIEEMRGALSLGFDRFFMSANTFTSSSDYCRSLCEAIREAGLDARAEWVCMTRVELVNRDLLQAMAQAGCVAIGFGVETASPGEWKSLRKGGYSEERIAHAFRVTKEVGIRRTAFVMLGAPDQTESSVQETVRLLRRLQPEHVVVNFFQPFPGTPYWTNTDQFGLSELEAFEDWNFHEAPVCRTRHMSKQELSWASLRLQMAASGPSGDPNKVTGHLRLEGLPPGHRGHPSVAALAEFLASGMDVGAALQSVNECYGPRDTLIAKYWLVAGARLGAFRSADKDQGHGST